MSLLITLTIAGDENNVLLFRAKEQKTRLFKGYKLTPSIGQLNRIVLFEERVDFFAGNCDLLWRMPLNCCLLQVMVKCAP
mmetsp:Transcript_6283/g.7307  ORF Transcript_6283/g.7307 Transcript_6283/m.7307 type:complete len:80 (+) Transcript_6283:595-834(+)